MVFCLFGTVLGGVYAAIVYFSLDKIEDHLVNRRLVQEVEYLLDWYQKNDAASASPTSPHISAFVGTDRMPDYLKQQVGGLPEGYHEFYWQGDEYHVAVKVVPQLVEPLYLLYEVSTLEFTEKRKLIIAIVLASGVVLVVVLGLWIGLILSRQIIAPVSYLAEQVAGAGPDKLPTNLSESFNDDEVGVLARALERSLQRIQEFVDREQQFTRDASHELRTPVTVIKGAIEVLRLNGFGNESAAQRPLKRIERAVKNMEHIIENLLWLAREEAANDPGQTCKALPVIKETIDHHRHLFAEKPVEISYITEGNPELKAPAAILKIVIANLIQNAYNHTAEGKVTVHIGDDCMTVTDTGDGIASCELQSVTEPHVRGKNSKGYGLGLAIVKRLCRRFNWKFEIESEIGRGTTVRLVFTPSEQYLPINSSKIADDK
jgi:signal transduction histidine kinase